VRQVTNRRTTTRAQISTSTPRNIGRTASHRRCRPAPHLPELFQLFAKLLARSGPVVSDAVAELGDVSFEVELVLFEPRHVEFLAGGTALELAGDVLFVVADDSVEV